MTHTIAFIGMGNIAHKHVDALSIFPEVSILGAYDPEFPESSARGDGPVRMAASLQELVKLHPDILVVAVPTRSHYQTCCEVLALGDVGTLFVEKPLATNTHEVRDLIDRAADREVVLKVSYHAAYAPEVVWAVPLLDSWQSEHGVIVNWSAYFADPYRDQDPKHMEYVYGNSWLDSGINALSVAARFIDLQALESISPLPPKSLRYDAKIGFRSGSTHGIGSVTTDWDVDNPDKWTSLTFDDGATLIMNHQQMQASLTNGSGIVVADYHAVNDPPRLVQHYRNVYAALFSKDQPFDLSVTSHIHNIMFGK